MKIGFDISQTGKTKAGCGFFAENLIHHLSLIDNQNQYTLYPTFGDHFWDKNFNHHYHINTANFSAGMHHTNQKEAKTFWQSPPHQIEKKLGHLDILHANNFFCPPPFKHTKLIYTLYDLSFLEHPEYTTEHNRVACFEGVFKASLNADFIIAISNYTREHFLKIFPYYPHERIITTYPASRFANFTPLTHQPKRLRMLQPDCFWLTVCTLEPRKNISRLLQAYAKLKANNKQCYPLVLAGGIGWIMGDINKLLQELDLKHDVYLLGYVDNAELQWLYQNCYCFIYPSLFEGFGLPVLEAMSLHAPVITSNVSSIPEVVGTAARLINPHNIDDIMTTMQDVATNKEHRNQLKKLSIQQARNFSWERTAASILALYHTMALSL